MNIAKLLIVAALVIIIATLFRGLYHMIKGHGNPQKTINSLIWRISLSIFLILLLIIGVATGFIEPHGITP